MNARELVGQPATAEHFDRVIDRDATIHEWGRLVAVFRKHVIHEDAQRLAG